MGNRMGRVKLRINSTRVFRNGRNCPSRDYLFITCRAKFLSKLGISKSSPFFTSKNTRSSETAKFSVVAQRSEQVKAYDYYKLLRIKRKVRVLFIDKT